MKCFPFERNKANKHHKRGNLQRCFPLIFQMKILTDRSFPYGNSIITYISAAQLKHAISQMIDDVHILNYTLKRIEGIYLFSCHMSAQKAHKNFFVICLLHM